MDTGHTIVDDGFDKKSEKMSEPSLSVKKILFKRSGFQVLCNFVKYVSGEWNITFLPDHYICC